VKVEQAQKLASACAEAIEHNGPMSAVQVFEVLRDNTELVRDVPVTVPSVSRSLRTLAKTKRLLRHVVENATIYRSFKQAAQQAAAQ